MSYAIIGFGKIGQALAHAFARRNIEVAIASRHPPEVLAPQAKAIGPTIIATSLQDALKADTIFLAVRSESHREVAGACRAGKARPSSMRRTPRLRWKRWTACCPPRSSPSSTPAPRS